VRPPIVVFSSTHASGTTFDVFARLNRKVRPQRHGYLLLDGLGGDGPVIPVSDHPDCYWNEVPGAGALRHPRDGQTLTVTLRIVGVDEAAASATVRARHVPVRAVSSNRAMAAYWRRLGCHVPTR